MAAPKYLVNLASGFKEIIATALGGAGNAEKIVSTNTSGVLDPSLFPAGIGADIVTMPASEALSAGNLVNIFADAGVAKARKADATVSDGGKKVDGFVLDSVAANGSAKVYRNGLNTSLTGLSPGLDYYLSATAGAAVTTATTVSGQTQQFIGKAVTATSLDVQPQPFTAIA